MPLLGTAATIDSAAASVAAAPSAFNFSALTIGAIRWDAWYSSTQGSVSQQAQAVLSPSQYQARAPWFSNVLSTSSIVSVGNQSNMDSEIGYATAAGLKFRAFNEYTASHDPDLRLAWSLYQSSVFKSKINWTWISDIGNLGSTGNFSSQVTAYVKNFQDPQYQTVLGGRPLWFLIWNASNFSSLWGSSYSNLAAMITSLRAATVAAGLQTPYIVVMDSIAGVATEMSSIGADAISYYNNSNVGNYAALVASNEAKWSTYAATGEPFIPTAIVGWDYRPFITTPEPWYNTGTGSINTYTADGAVTQVAQHIRDGAAYVKANPAIVPSSVLLIYAWDECAEGGANMLIPTLGDPPPSSLLAAVASVLT